MTTIIDNGTKCVFCGDDTAMGSGKFVNRIPADNYNEDTDTTTDGWSCADCMARECDRCPEPIALDEDIYIDRKDSDHCEYVHYECLTDDERIEYEKVGTLDEYDTDDLTPCDRCSLPIAEEQEITMQDENDIHPETVHYLCLTDEERAEYDNIQIQNS